MKNSLKFLVGSIMLLSVVALTACNSGGGGGSSDPGVSALGANGTPGYLGVGQWSGGLVGQNTASPQYQQFLFQYGGGGGADYTTIINFSVWSGNNGMLPARMGFKINNRSLGGDGFLNGNGFLINNYVTGNYYGNTPYYPNQTQCFAYPCQQPVNPVANGTPVIQITGQFVDVCRTQLQIQLRFQNVVVASGLITGWVQQQSPTTYGYPGYPNQQTYNPQCVQQQPYQQQQYPPYNNY